MPRRREVLQVTGNRIDIRKQVISKFLNEEPGTGMGDACSRYIYEVEELANGNCVILKRPAPLNKGVDFEVHIENIIFREKGMVHMPSHVNIKDDLLLKRAENLFEYEEVKNTINKLYRCELVTDLEYRGMNFASGHPIEAILKAIKWLFIEQDVTYWNWSGRNKLFTYLKENDLC